jgi:cytoskeletal protein CcmA (bactofilin family)
MLYDSEGAHESAGSASSEIGGLSMFKKNQDNQSLASSPKIGDVQPIRSRNVSVIGPTLTFRGELSADEDLIIEGMIEGTIAHHDKNITIGKQGRVIADIHANSVIIEGELKGDIHSDGLVSLADGASVTGNIYCARVVMHEGAWFSGKIDMGTMTPARADDEPDGDEEDSGEPEDLTA